MTTKLRTLVLEDEWAARNYLTELIERSGLATVSAAAADTEQAWAALDGTLPVDVAFVDIQLAGEASIEAGMDGLRAVKHTPTAAQLDFVLTTTSRTHAIEAYSLAVFDYLVKPFTPERVASCLARLAERRPPRAEESAAPRRVVARDGKKLVFLPVSEALAFEAAEGLSYVYAPSGRYEIDLSLAAIASSLGGDFVRVHRNWLAQLGAVREFERGDGETHLVVGEGELRVPVARDRATQVRDALMATAVGVRRTTG